jgi:ribosomal protein S9
VGVSSVLYFFNPKTRKFVFQKDKIGLGKRKRAVARVFVVPGDGKATINKVSGEKYLQYNTNYLNAIWSPLEKLNLKNQFIYLVFS